jgi:hypothetical protein
MAEPGLSEIITTTARNRQKKLRDNVTNNNAALLSMEEYEGIVEEDGGRTIIEEVAYAENGTYIRYDGGQPLNTNYNPTMTSFEVDWKQWGVGVVITGREERMNSGYERCIKLVSSRLKIAEDTLQNNVNADILSLGTSDGGKQIGGLALWIAKVATSVVGGIDRNTAGGAFAQNFTFQPSATAALGSVATSPATVKLCYTYGVTNTTRGQDRTKLILAGIDHYQYFASAMQAIQRVTDPRKAQAGFTTLEFMGIPVVLGGGVSFGGQTLVPHDQTWGLNTKYLKFHVHKDANSTPLPEVQSINQDMKVQLIIGMGNLTSSAPRLSWNMWDS